MKSTIVERFLNRVAIYPKEIAYYAYTTDGFKPYDWEAYGAQVRDFVKGLLAFGFEPRERLAILSFNRPEWAIACIGAQMANGVSVGVYTNSSAQEVHHILFHSEASIVVIENQERFHKQLSPILDQLPALKRIVMMDPGDGFQHEKVVSFEAFVQSGCTVLEPDLKNRMNAINAQEMATIIYTSGTTGSPKGAMLSHKNIYWTAQTTIQMAHVGRGDTMISYLPLAHIAEQMFSVYAPIMSGMSLYFAQSMERLPQHLKEVKPTLFFGVPRVYEKMYDKIIAKIKTLPYLNKKLIERAQKVAFQYWSFKNNGSNPNILTALQYGFVDGFILSKIRKELGFERTRMCIVGAAPVDKAILNFFQSLGLLVCEVYGQTETSGPSTINLPGKMQIGTVGKALKGVEIRVAEDGEICVKGQNVFMGYYKDPVATEETLKDRWLLTGDVGVLDTHGYLSITDRKKDLLITSGGKNISPQNIEKMLRQIPFVNSAVVLGDRQKYLVALLTADKDRVDGLSMAQVKKTIQEEIHKMNARLSPVEQIKNFALLSKDFSVETGELTPTLKIKRKYILTRYEQEIKQLYT